MTNNPLRYIRGTIESIANWFKMAKPAHNHGDFQVQLGVHFEEISEMCDALTGIDPRTTAMINTVRDQTHLLAERLKTAGSDFRVMINIDDRVEFLDALCDQIVTATGTGVFAGYDIGPAIEEVDCSNYSKFVDGKAVLDENGKIAKGPAYFKAVLSQFT